MRTIAEGNNALVLAELTGERGIQFGELRQRFANNGERSLDCHPQHYFLTSSA
jgi:hypothetical protein